MTDSVHVHLERVAESAGEGVQSHSSKQRGVKKKLFRKLIKDKVIPVQAVEALRVAKG
jgi:hypothetical protein